MNTQTKRTPAVAADIADNTLTLTFANGETLAISPEQLTTDIQTHAMLHGLKQKLVDAAAISRDPMTGRSATVDDKYNAVRAVFDRIMAGAWNAVREGGGTTSGGLLFRALCKLYENKTPEQITAFLAAKSDEEKAALRKNPRVAAIIAELRATKSGDVDTDGLLGELENV